MSGDAWIVLLTLLAMVAVMVRGVLSPPAAVVAATGIVFVLDVIDAEAALSGLSNPAAISIAGLYLVAGAVSRAQLMQPVVGALIGTGGGGRRTLARLALPAAGGSAFLANTPIVAMLVPVVVQWGDERRVSASKFLLPLSYATILGGMLTVIGTSTNLVASGITDDLGLGPLDLFEPAAVAWPVALAGLVVTIAIGPKVLPARRRPSDDPDERPFTTAMRVLPEGPLVDRTVTEVGLRDLEGVYLVAIEREGSTVAPVAPDRRLDADDRLVFVGDVARVRDLDDLEGLAPLHDGSLDGDFYEVTVASASTLTGRSIRDAGFRARHGAAVVGVHRAGAHLTRQLGPITLRAGDALLLLVGPEFDPDGPASRVDFSVCTHLGAARAPRPGRVATGATVLALALLVGLPAFGVTSVLRAVTLAAIVLFAGRVLRPADVWELIDLRVVAMIAAAFGLGRAVAESGLSHEIADAIVSVTGDSSPLIEVLGVLLVTMLLTELITNAAAVALALPIALEIAETADLDPKRMAVGVAVAASASFLTPIGYQTNTMVYGPGRYRFTDYLRLGLPLWGIAWIGTAVSVVHL